MGTSSAPVYPYPGGSAGAEPPDPSAGAGGHFAWSNWIKQFVKNLDSGAVKRSGDTMLGDLEFGSNRLLFGTGLVRMDYTSLGSVHGVRVVSGDGSTYRNISAASPTHAQHLVTKGHLDTALAGVGVSGETPIGSIVMFGSATPPAGWLLCNGQSTSGYTALAAIVGANVPDLRDRFIVGAGGAYAQKNVGGAAQVTLTAAESGLREHGHTAASGAASAAHTHAFAATTGAGQGAHTHPSPSGYDYALVTNGGNPTSAKGSGSVNYVEGYTDTVTNGGAHNHSVSGNTGSNSVSHTHSIGVDNAASSPAQAAHENRPPYYALTFIIRAV